MLLLRHVCAAIRSIWYFRVFPLKSSLCSVYGDVAGQSTANCTGECLDGVFCDTHSTSPLGIPCPAGESTGQRLPRVLSLRCQRNKLVHKILNLVGETVLTSRSCDSVSASPAQVCTV
jgi:hypothetical protein